MLEVAAVALEDLSEFGPFLSRTTPRLLAVVFAALAVLFVFTGYLARHYRAMRFERARAFFVEGQRLVQQKRYEQAIQAYTQALALDRDNPVYKRGLATALYELGRLDEAEAYLVELARQDPSDGWANLMLARIYARRGRLDDAIAYYQRAIYGLWPQHPLQHRLETRFELVGLLQRQGRVRQMQAELLRLADEMPADPELMKRVGKLFLAARAPHNAAELFRQVARRFPKDPEALAGLGDAEFEAGNYEAARAAYRQAVRYRPSDVQSQTQLELATEILQLDPFHPGLSPIARLERSRQILQRTLRSFASCVPSQPTDSEVPAELRDTVQRARQLLDRKAKRRALNQTPEENLRLAASLAEKGREYCGPPAVPDRAIELLLERFQQLSASSGGPAGGASPEAGVARQSAEGNQD